VGFLSFAPKVVPDSRPFLRRLYDTLTSTPRTTTYESHQKSRKTSPGARCSSAMERNPTTTLPTLSYGQTHLDSKESGATFSDQEKLCLAYAHQPSSSVLWSHRGTKPNTSTLKKCTPFFTHYAPGQSSPQPVPSNYTATMRQSWQHLQKEASKTRQSAHSGK